MNIKELIDELTNYNPSAEVGIVINNKPYDFTLAFGSADGCEKHNCESVSFYIEELNTNENSRRNNNPISIWSLIQKSDVVYVDGKTIKDKYNKPDLPDYLIFNKPWVLEVKSYDEESKILDLRTYNI
jgi:hypothetical protein